MFVLDHFYVSLSGPLFRELIEIKNVINGARHKKTQSGESIFEGIYLSDSTDMYFEILNRESGEDVSHIGLGTAIHPTQTDRKFIDLLKEKFPSISFSENHQTFGPDHLPWFTSIWNSELIDREIIMWAIDYRQLHHVEERRKAVEASPILGYQRLELEAPPQFLRRIEKIHSWLPGKKESTKGRYSCSIPMESGKNLEIDVYEKENTERCEFRRVHFSLKENQGISFESPNFRIRCEGRSCTLERNSNA